MALGGKREGAGRKKGFAALEAERARLLIAEKLATEFLPIVEKAIEQAKEGNKDARDWLTDRAFGKARQAVELTGKDGESLFDNESKDKAKNAITEFVGTDVRGGEEA